MRISPFVGFIGGIVGIVGGMCGIAKTRQELFKRPRTTIEAHWPLAISTTSDLGASDGPGIVLEFSLLLRNDGTGVDSVNVERAIVQTHRGDVFLSPTGFSFLERGQMSRLPFALEPHRGREVLCRLAVPLSVEETKRLQAVGLKELILLFKTVGTSASVRLCFWMSDFNARVLFSGERIRYVEPDPQCVETP